MRRLFVDTGPFYARHLPRDQHHGEALLLWEEVLKLKPRLFTSNFVLDEVVTLLARAVGNREAVKCARGIYGSSLMSILSIDRKTEESALAEMEKWSGGTLSFTDATSFVVMRREAIEETFSFDADFARAGFRLFAS